MLVVQHSADLAYDFAGTQVAFHAQQGSHAEPAIDGAAYLAGNANSRPIPCPSHPLLELIAGFAAIPGLAPIALGHPDSLNALAVGKGHEVANGAILRNELFLHSGEDRPQALAVVVAEKVLGTRGTFLNRRNRMAMEAFKQLLRALLCLLAV